MVYFFTSEMRSHYAQTHRENYFSAPFMCLCFLIIRAYISAECFTNLKVLLLLFLADTIIRRTSLTLTAPTTTIVYNRKSNDDGAAR